MKVMASAASKPQCRAANRHISLMASDVAMRGQRKAYPSAVTVIGYFIFGFQPVMWVARMPLQDVDAIVEAMSR